jgi:isoquinoline 1-oxidoreductase beta subunit
MTFEVTRRSFLAGVGAAMTGLALGVTRFADASNKGYFIPNVFIQIGQDGVVLITCHRSEMGQGIRSSLPVLIADEMGADHTKIVVRQADGDKAYGDQNTDGSTSIRSHFVEMRTVAAAAREMLVAEAAERWKVPAKRLVAKDSAVWDGTRSLPFAELASGAGLRPVPKTPALRPRKELVHVGTDLPLRDGHAYVTGTAQFAADIVLPGMLTAVIARPPVVFGTVATVDDKAAKATPGVRHVVTLPALVPPAGMKPLGGVAVIADHTWAAMKGRAALSIAWDAGANGEYESDAYAKQLLAAVRAPGDVVRKVGDFDASLPKALSLVEAEYLVPHLVHAPMEPPAALAHFHDGRLEVWACTQSPQDAREAIAQQLGIPEADITVHVTFLGGGFGRKSKPDFLVEAALCARAAKAPVRVQWTREDEIRHAYYHTCSVQALAASIDERGNVLGWRHRIAYPTISSTFDGKSTRPSGGELGQGAVDLPLAVPNVRVETAPAPAHVRIGWMRSVANIQQAFAVQSFIAEISEAAKRDPRDTLLAVLGKPRKVTAQELGVMQVGNYGAKLDEHPIDVARYHRVIERVTTAAKWDAAKREGRALGLAVHKSFLSYIAVVAQVSRGARGELVVDEAWMCADAGTIINADRVRAQLEGAFIFGMSIALTGAITMRDGATIQRNFKDYPIVRMPAAPKKLHVDIVPSDGPPGGVGEPGVPPVAPAILNAWFALTNQRVRDLPLVRASL